MNRHSRGGGANDLRAAVLGANDRLVSNLSLVMGVAEATASLPRPMASSVATFPLRVSTTIILAFTQPTKARWLPLSA